MAIHGIICIEVLKKLAFPIVLIMPADTGSKNYSLQKEADGEYQQTRNSNHFWPAKK